MKKKSWYVGARGLCVQSCLPRVKKHQSPILFVHGAFGGSWCWDYFLGYFAKEGWDCYALNLRGHHLSAPLDLGQVHATDYVEDVREVAGQIGNVPIFFGSSMGGIITQKYVESYPARAAVLLGSTPPKGIERPGIDPTPIDKIPPIVEMDRETFRLIFPEASMKKFEKYYRLASKESGTARREWRIGMEVDPSKITCPVLVVGGELDVGIPPCVCEKIVEYYHADYLYFEGISHLGMLLGNRWEEVASGIHNWLARQGL